MLFQKLFHSYKERIRRSNELCDKYISRIDAMLCDAKNLFTQPNSYIEPEDAESRRQQSKKLLEDFQNEKILWLKCASHFRKLRLKIGELEHLIGAIRFNVDQHNIKIAKKRIDENQDLLSEVEGCVLDEQQMLCVVYEARNQLVIAGAGTGKTTTILGKIKYLLATGEGRPNEILVLSFTNASAAEMRERIRKETNTDISASTFHKLGLDIITQVDGVRPKITMLDLRSFIRDELTSQMMSGDYLQIVNNYLLHSRIPTKSEFDFKTQAEYSEFLKLNPPTTLKGELVKSYGEMEIANFLMQNNIKYVYEAEYKIETRDAEYGQYHPDFYLPDHDIYLEYFAVDKKGNTPDFFHDTHGMTGTEFYRTSMNWKRKTHKNNHTILIECYAHEKFDGVLLKNLKMKLEKHSVQLSPKSPQKLWQEILEADKNAVDGLVDLLTMTINLIKSNNYTVGQVRELNVARDNLVNNTLLLDLVEPIIEAYDKRLKEQSEVDFNDMINLATKYVQQGKYRHHYKHVIIDEYQDISKSRFRLLHAMRETKDYTLFCVGDDWQSIYRFTGSDIGFILDFERFWGAAEIGKIETTYRFPQSLIQASSNFVMQNPAQITKQIQGRVDENDFALEEINGYTDQTAIEFMIQRLNDLPRESTVFFLGRYSFDVQLLSSNGHLICRYDNVEKRIVVKYNWRPDLKMYFLTVHKSKGLQADYVFILNNKNARMGFPSKIEDVPIVELLLENCDSYPYAEERRLYYVALTRAKNKSFFITTKNHESTFALELRKRYDIEMRHARYTCPRCGGRLVRRQGPRGEFFGCSNYITTRCSYTRRIPRRLNASDHPGNVRQRKK